MQVAREDATGETRRFEWDKQNLLLETDDLGTPLARNTHEPDEYGRLVSREDLTTSEPAYYHYDALGSTAALSDPTEVVGDEYQYKAWGEQTAPTADPQPYRWVGELGYRYDDDTNRHNLRRRDYDSHLAQFLSQDPPDGDDDPNGSPEFCVISH